MIDKKIVESIVNQQINSKNEFVVDITISSNNKINVVIDSETGVTIDRCVDVSRAIEQKLDRDVEDYELEVASAGLSEPLKIVRQYLKNIGRDVDVVLVTGEKKTGKLLAANDQGFTILMVEKELVEGKKRKQLVEKEIEIAYNQVKSTKIVISFR